MQKSAVRLKCFAVLATTVAVFGLGLQAASASVTHQQIAAWTSVDAKFGKADLTWTTALSSMSNNTPASKLSKACLAFVPAVNAFDASLKKIGFTGKTATDIASLIKLNNQLVPILSHIKSVKSFEAQFLPIDRKYFVIQEALSKDLGIEEAEIQI
jgi:hypothetical protein